MNRKVLKSQIEEEIKNLAVQDDFFLKYYNIYSSYIKILTYQSIEQDIKKCTNCYGYQQQINYMMPYSYIVYDECHYFDMDSLYNTCTQLSFDFLFDCFFGKIQIYISATMDRCKDMIQEKVKKYKNLYSPYCNKVKEISYNLEVNYDYLKVSVLVSDDQLVDLILKKMDKRGELHKWLIFTDSKKRGKELITRLEIGFNSDNRFSLNDVVFIDAEYEKNIEASESIQQLRVEEKIDRKVVITTSVMDNGISFKDIALRNIVIMADTKEEFIQMLGRKRQDGESVKLFIMKNGDKYFRERRMQIEGIRKAYQDFENDFNRLHPSVFLGQNGNWYHVDKFDKFEWTFCIGVYSAVINRFVTAPWVVPATFLLPTEQQNILCKMMEQPRYYYGLQKFVFILGGYMNLNNLSVRRILYLEKYYQNLEDETIEDSDTFLKKQLSWIGIDCEAATKIIAENNQDNFEYHANVLNIDLEKQVGVQMGESEWKKWKIQHRESLRYVCSNCKEITEEDSGTVNAFLNGLDKNDRAISKKFFPILMKIINGDYELEKKDDKFIITKK